MKPRDDSELLKDALRGPGSVGRPLDKGAPVSAGVDHRPTVLRPDRYAFVTRVERQAGERSSFEVLDPHVVVRGGDRHREANDGTPRVWFSVLRPTSGGIAIEPHALDYDQATAAAKMRARGFPAGYAECLETGLWPSCDILPEAERAARGRRLAPGAVCSWPAREIAAAAE